MFVNQIKSLSYLIYDSFYYLDKRSFICNADKAVRRILLEIYWYWFIGTVPTEYSI